MATCWLYVGDVVSPIFQAHNPTWTQKKRTLNSGVIGGIDNSEQVTYMPNAFYRRIMPLDRNDNRVNK